MSTTKAHGSTLYLGSPEMELMIGLLDHEIDSIEADVTPDPKRAKQCKKLIDKLRSKQYHPTRKK